MPQLVKNKLQYNNEFLDKIIISALMDQKFLIKCIDLDVSQYIDSQPHKWLLKFIIEFYSQYKVSPTMQSIKIKIEGLKQPLFKQTISTTYISIIDKFDENNLEFIKDTVVNFCRFQQLKSAIMKSIDLLKEEDFEQIYDLINQTRFKGIDNGMGIEYVSSFLQRHSSKLQTYKVVETPWTVLNNVMDGGAKSGRLNLIASPPGTGKSWFLCNIASHALKLGKKVVYYTLEMEQWQIAQRIDIKLLDKSKQYIHANAEKLAPQLQGFRDNLRVKQFLPNHTKLVEIQNHITQLILFENFDPDVIIIDHGDNLKLQGNANNLYGAYGTNFVGMKTLAKRTKKIVWSGSQGNRCLSKDSLVVTKNKGQIKIENVQIGDLVETPNGFKNVSDVFKQRQPIYKIKLKNGLQIKCSINHEFPVKYGLLKSLQTGLSISDKLYVKNSKKTVRRLFMKMHRFNNKEFNLQLVQIESIQLIGQQETVDITVDEDHVFFANKILTHNSSINQQLLLGDGISHSMMKLEIADFVISLSRKHEDKLSNTARFVIVKNRHGKDGMVYNGLVDLQMGDIQIFDTYTKESANARSKMDNNDKLMKQKVRQRLAAINNKTQGESSQ